MTDRCFHFTRQFDSTGSKLALNRRSVGSGLPSSNISMSIWEPSTVHSSVLVRLFRWPSVRASPTMSLGELSLQWSAQRRGRQRPGSFSTCTMPLMTRRSSARSTPRTIARGCFCYSHAGPARSDLRAASEASAERTATPVHPHSDRLICGRSRHRNHRVVDRVRKFRFLRWNWRGYVRAFQYKLSHAKHCRVFSSADAEF
jgi:hypothetical protein